MESKPAKTAPTIRIPSLRLPAQACLGFELQIACIGFRWLSQRATKEASSALIGKEVTSFVDGEPVYRKERNAANSHRPSSRNRRQQPLLVGIHDPGSSAHREQCDSQNNRPAGERRAPHARGQHRSGKTRSLGQREFSRIRWFLPLGTATPIEQSQTAPVALFGKVACYCRNTSSSSTTSPGKSGVVTLSLAANRWIGFSRSSSNANRESSHGTGSMIQSSFTPSLA